MASSVLVDVRPPRTLRVAGALVEPLLNRVTRNGKVERLEPKIMDVLLALASRPGEVVSKDELLSAVWNGTYVTEDVLTRAIGELRKLFDDDATTPHVIETIRKRGYRLVAPVEETHRPAAERAVRPPLSRAAIAGAAGLALLVGVAG